MLYDILTIKMILIEKMKWDMWISFETETGNWAIAVVGQIQGGGILRHQRSNQQDEVIF